MRITLCLSARCTLTYAPFGSPTSSLQGSPHYRLRPAATLRSLIGLPLYWDASSPERRTARWRARPAERHAGGRLRSQPSQARAAAPGGEQRDCPPPNPTQIPFPSVSLSPLFKRPPCMMGACAGVR